MYKVLIVDDERHARNEIKLALKDNPQFELFESATFEDALISIANIQPDLIFLDIQLNGKKTGFDVLEQIDYLPQVIFVTAFDQYAIQAFEKNALDYLLKPFDSVRFNSALEKALFQLEITKNRKKSLLNLNDKVFVKDGDKCWMIRLSEITSFESCGNYAKVFFNTEKALILKSLNLLEKRLDPQAFFRTSRTHIINIEKIKEIKAYGPNLFHLLLIDDQQISLSRRQSVKFRELLSL